MKMLGKITDCESLEISQENFYDEASFSKVTNLQCSDCNFPIKRTHRRFLLEYAPKTSCLLRKMPMMDQRLIKVAVLWYTTLSFIKKAELM